MREDCGMDGTKSEHFLLRAFAGRFRCDSGSSGLSTCRYERAEIVVGERECQSVLRLIRIA